MSYQIEACLRDGVPHLEILDAQAGHLRMAWEPRSERGVTQDDLHQLFRELMLLSEADRTSPA